MNLQNYYTKTQALYILQAPNDYHLHQARKTVRFAQLGNRYLYHREDLENYQAARLRKTGQDDSKIPFIKVLFPPVDLDLTPYCTLTEALTVWPFSKEWLYSLSAKRGRDVIKTITIDGLMLFDRNSMNEYVDKRKTTSNGSH